MDNYFFNRFEFTEAYRDELIEAVRRMGNYEYGGYRLYDGTGTHYMQNAVEIAGFIFALKQHEIDRGKKLATFLEIGYSAGINNTLLHKFFQFEDLVAVDLMQPGGVCLDTVTANLRFKNLALLCGNSHDEKVVAKAKLLGSYDLIFLDGGHRYEDIQADFADYSPMLNPGGVIGFHDIKSTTFPGVAQFWSELKAEKSDEWEFEEFFEAGNNTDYGIGKMTRRR